MAITKPYTFVAGTKAKAVEVNTDFDILYEESNRLDTEILNVKLDVQDIGISKADINGNATQRFQLANPENSYDGVNKNYLENSIANIKDYISGYVITKDTDNSIIVSAGSCYDSTFTTIINSTGNITKQNSTQSPSTTYYVYMISDNDGYNVDILIAQEAITPPLPSGYTLFRQIGSYTTDSDSKIYIIKSYGNNYNVPSATATIVKSYIKGTSGYIVYSNNLCVQWGRQSHGGGRTVTFLLPFRDTNFIANATVAENFQNDALTSVRINSFTSTQMTTRSDSVNNIGYGANQSPVVNWVVIGYI